MPNNRWDKRRSGRTTKMLAAAMRRCFDGRHVYVVLPNTSMLEYCIDILEDMGATRIRPVTKIVEFGSGCELHLITLNSQAIAPHSFELKGIHDENVFWDHEAVRQRNNHILQRYHEYD
jgi:hypothetical protein